MMYVKNVEEFYIGNLFFVIVFAYFFREFRDVGIGRRKFCLRFFRRNGEDFFV